MEPKDKKTNRLILEKSPYLLQHAHNPVDWFPWGKEAFERAKAEDKPVFVSIGYSTCHWCHVMERESFEDKNVADLLNSSFICIKVDREERPDIDDIYMTVCQLMTGRGGWPLTVITTPDKKPFFSGTYIPKTSRYGMTGMLDLIPKINELWSKKRNDIEDSAEGVTETLRRYSMGQKGDEIDDSVLKAALGDFLTSFDETYGGFGTQPKFPTPHNLLFLLRNQKRTGSRETLHMVEKTLNAMMMGGIWDHVGGGFHRYSTDRFWLVPHFEKMLYDQALLAMAYTEAFQQTQKEEYRDVVEGILEYVLGNLHSPEGGFFCAEDADSEGEEGKFYLWAESEIKKVLGDSAETFIRIFNVRKEGNYTDEMSGRKTKKNILHTSLDLAMWSSELDIPLDELKRQINSAKETLWKAREKRIRPHKDDKILCDWTGLMIAALSKAYQVNENPRYLEAAESAAAFVLGNMTDDQGHLLHRIRFREAKISGFLSDYAFFTWGLLELYESTFNAKYLKTALNLIEHLDRYFWDEKGFGYYSTADYAEELIVRKKESYDGAVPSPNSVLMMVLQRLARITGELRFEERAGEIQRAFSKSIEKLPTAHTLFLSALDFALGPTYEIVIVGDLNSKGTQDMLRALRKTYIPNKVVVHKPLGPEMKNIESLIPYTASMRPINGKTAVYVCRNHTCNLPATDPQTVLKLLSHG